MENNEEISIMGIENTVAGLCREDRDLFEGIFELSTYTGKIVVTDSFKPRAVELFKATTDTIQDLIEEQTIIRTYNKWTNEAAIFNSLRSKRPGLSDEQKAKMRSSIDEEVKKAMQGCDFCDAENLTPEDIIRGGRVKTDHCVTASNVAKMDAWSSLIIFKEHHPLKITEEEFVDYVKTANAWFERVHEVDPKAEYPLIGWNCLKQAGASQCHGHMQLLMARDRPYAELLVELKAAEAYKGNDERKDYFRDLFVAHDLVGLGMRDKRSRIFPSLTPYKERETVVMAPSEHVEDGKEMEDFSRSLFKVVDSMINEQGVYCFNVGIWLPKMNDNSGRQPYIAKIVDRGPMIAVMEMYGESVVGIDPYRAAESLRKNI